MKTINNWFDAHKLGAYYHHLYRNRPDLVEWTAKLKKYYNNDDLNGYLRQLLN